MSEKRWVYYDYAAGGPCREEALQAMNEFAREHYSNPGAHHPLAYRAKHLLEDLHARAAKTLDVDPREIVFTSGGTEGDVMALRGVMNLRRDDRNELVVSAIEHHAIMEEAERLEREGVTVHRAPVTSDGVVDLDALRKLVTEKTLLVSVMYANNETGVIQPVSDVAKIAHDHGALFHCDAVQAFGKVELRPREFGADLMTLASAKFGGPKGMGLVYNRMTNRIAPLIVGGPQQWGLRAGTENLSGISGMVTAMELADGERDGWKRVAKIRDDLQSALVDGLGERVLVHGRDANRLPNILNVSFKDIEGQAMGIELGERGFCVGLGSACAPGETDPSHVLAAMGVSWDDAQGCIRISFGPDIDADDVERLGALCLAHYDALCGLS